jgi:hypothetical protein
VRPHANDFDGPDFVEDLINEAVLDIDPAGKSPGQISHELFERWGSLVRILSENIEENLDFFSAFSWHQFLDHL